MSVFKQNYKSGLTASVAIIGAMLMADAAIAQVNEDDEIIVTARRQAETLIEVPVAVAAFNEAAIEDLGLRSVDDVARHTAGFSFSQAFGRTTERPVIRGAANILAGVQFGVESGAAYFIDGVYYSGDLQALDTRGLERVEVIKGAQSALYGRNTYSGAVNFITKRPSKDGFEGSAEALVAEDGEVEVYGRISNSLADNRLGFSLSGRYYEYGGDSAWINADGGEQLGKEQTLSFNAVVDADFSDNFSVLARLGYVEDRDGARPFSLVGAENNNCFPGYRSGAYYNPNHLSFLNPPFAGIFPDSVTTDSTFQYFCGNLSQFEDQAPAQTLSSGPIQGVIRDMTFGTLKADYDLDNGYTVMAQAGFRAQDIIAGSDSTHQVGTMNFFPISPFFSIPQADGLFYNAALSESFDYSGELRVASPAEARVRWSAGGFYYKSEDDRFSVSFANTAPDFIGGLGDTLTVENKAIFATLDFDVTEQLSLSFEARYQEEEKGLIDRAESVITYDEVAKSSDFIPKAIISYDMANGASLYGSYAHGVKPGGINGPIGIPTNNESYLPEESDSFEIGFKTRTGDGKGQITLAAFFNDISQYQLTTPVAVAGSTAVNSVATNQGNAEIMGFEFEGFYDLTDNLTLGGTYAYTDAEFTSGCDDFQFTLNSGGYLISPFDQSNPPSVGTIRGSADPNNPTFDPDGLFTGNLSCSIAGNKIPMTSEHQASIYSRFEMPVNDTMNFFTNADLTYESSKFIQVHNGMETGGATLLGAQIGVKFDSGLRMEIFGRNILNERTPPIATRWFDFFEGFSTISASTPGATSVDRNPTGPRGTFISYRRGSQFGVRVKADF
ncbi:TonB-dependent receptor [Fretibacter rubidus]|uniref:TonB-dependent receptor n=1 Tax=Fretibacter rubidus TaxID=570162 RepID=UPI00352BBC46